MVPVYTLPRRLIVIIHSVFYIKITIKVKSEISILNFTMVSCNFNLHTVNWCKQGADGGAVYLRTS